VARRQTRATLCAARRSLLLAMFNMLTGSKGRYPGLKQNGYTEVRRLGKGAFGFALLVKRGNEGHFVAKLQKCAPYCKPHPSLQDDASNHW
jgi:hypothetical protein